VRKVLNITFRPCLVFSLIVAAIFCLYIGNVAIGHNSMEEYCRYVNETECDIVWQNLLPLLLFWFVVIFIPSLIILLIFKVVYQKLSGKQVN